MTITYTGKVANAKLFGFSRLLLYWKGSIYKLMYKEMLVFCAIYTTLSLTYRLALTAEQKRLFEKMSMYCEAFINLIPLSFVLGFYVSLVVTRWWQQYLNIPWTDRVMMYVTTMIEGCDERGRLIRRQLMRYMSLASLIVFQATSISVKKRFPTMEHLLDAGMITLEEIEALEEVNTPHGKWWVPMIWSCNLVKQARKEGRITDEYSMKTILDEIHKFRGGLGNLYSYDWISVPLVYTQVTTLAVYTFFVGSILGRQFLDPEQGIPGHEVDLYIPIFTLLQFFFYMGWLKVAEQLINPFGEDDDDFNLNWVIDRNMQVSFLAVDDLHGALPTIQRDIYYGDMPPECLPYTKSSISTLKQPYMGSTADLSVSNAGMQVVNPMETIPEGIAINMNQATSSSQFNNHMAYTCSPQTSPGKTRRLHNMILNGLKSPLGNSKVSLEGMKIGSVERDLKLTQPLNGVGLCSRQSYLEDWLSEHESTLGNGSTNLSKSPTIADSMPQTPVADGMFPMELEDDMNPTQKTANHDLRLHLMGLGFLNRDLERVRQNNVVPAGGNAGSAVTATVSGGVNAAGNGGGGSKKGQQSVLSSAPEVFRGLVEQGEKAKVIRHNSVSSGTDKAKKKELSLRTYTDQSDPSSKPATRLVRCEDDIPTIVVMPYSAPPAASSPRRQRNLSESSKSSSCSSLPSVESRDNHQNTVTSITPLLNAESSPHVNI